MTRRATRMFSLTRTQRYGIAVFGVMLAAAVRLVLDPFLKQDLPFFLFTIPIIVAAWWGGFGPGLLATSLSLFIGEYLFMRDSPLRLRYPPRRRLSGCRVMRAFGRDLLPGSVPVV